MLFYKGVDKYTKIWTDGGTSSNVPPFGIGYGSFRIGKKGKIFSISFNAQMSCNAAEIYTMVHALAKCKDQNILLFSDSKIALKWLNDAPNRKLEVKENISDEMKKSISLLRENALGRKIKGKWRPRAQIYKIFGH